MSERFSLRIEDWFYPPDRKRTLNLRLFTEVAPRYDFVTRVLSLGRDRAWKRGLVKSLPGVDSPFCIDIACGTGDISLLLAEKYRKGEVHGIDLTPLMLTLANQQATPRNLQYSQQDMCSLGFPDASADIVTGGYALRNAPDLDGALGEISRVLKPGGVAGFLDFSKPPSRFMQGLWQGVLRIWGGFWGLLLHGNPSVYIYIAESLKRFPDRDKLRANMINHGLELVHSQRHQLGLIEILVVKKKA